MKLPVFASRFSRWLCVAAVAVAGGAASAATPVQSSFELQVPVAPTPLTILGAPQLVYELHLTNFAEHTLVLKRVRVLDQTGAVVADLGEAALDRGLGRPGATSAAQDKRSVMPGARVVLYLDLALKDRATPSALRHSVTYGVVGKTASATAILEGASIAVNPTPAPVLGPPLRGGPWAAIHHPAWPRGHRRMMYAVDGHARIPGRYAIDWIKLDAKGRAARGDKDRVRAWYGHGEDVLAVADGVIAATRDDIAESATISAHVDHPLEDASGNYIALDLGGGHYAFYEHLRPESLRVKTGQRVRRGQVIASLGFTGDSTGPHLHFHVADANAPIAAEGLPYVLHGFDLIGAYDTLDAFGDAPWKPIDQGTDPHRASERPASNTVVRFDP